MKRKECPTDHIDELRDGEAELDDDHVRDVGDGSGPLVVAGEQSLEELVLGVGVGLIVAQDCGDTTRSHPLLNIFSFILC